MRKKCDENLKRLEKRGVLAQVDYVKMVQQCGKWATHLAISQADPLSATRGQILERAQRLQNRIADWAQ